jgi:hypothetical protein
VVCYARPAAWLAAILVVAWLVFAEPVSHFLDSAALVVAVTAATAGAAVAAAFVFATFVSTRRRRAAAGGCVSCRFRCQHAMTEQVRRPWLVTTADRGPAGTAPGQQGNPGYPGSQPTRSVPVLLPMPTVRSAAPASAPPGSCGPAGPRWPDRPVHRSNQRERATSPALSTPGVQRGVQRGPT